MGVAAADVYLRHFEAAVVPLLQQLPGAAHLVNGRGRVATSADPAHLAGSLTKGPDFGAVLAGARTTRHDGMRLIPCAGVPLVLVAICTWSGPTPRTAERAHTTRSSAAPLRVLRGPAVMCRASRRTRVIRVYPMS